MRSRFGILLSSLALLQILGGHWAALQVTAWVGMLVKYSQAEGVQVGISKTFDGKHPCDLCVSIAKNTQTEKKQGVAAGRRQDLPGRLQPSVGRCSLPAIFWCLRSAIASLVGSGSSPPVPPPRAS